MFVWSSKGPNETVSRSISWENHPSWTPNDRIISSSFSLSTAAGMTITSTDDDGYSVSLVGLSGGTVETRGKVLCQVTTHEGQTLQETATILIRER
jgi:hypothetical protein